MRKTIKASAAGRGLAAAARLGLLGAAALFILGAASSDSARADAVKQPTVVELFTSQGCSSCPPADALLTKLSQRPDVIALSLHVDYWDYIGWKDPFGSPENTDRQHEYARVLHQRYVYTPEMVMNGVKGTIGSRDGEVNALLEKVSKDSARLRVPVAASEPKPGTIAISIPAAEYRGKAAVWLFAYDSQRVTNVERGENTGRTLTNTNVVRAIRRVGDWTGAAMTVNVPLDQPGEQGHDGCAIVVQDDEYGPILGAASLAIHAPPTN